MDTETARRYANLTSTKNSQTQIVSNNSVGIQSRGTVNVDDDTLTNMIIWNTLNSNSGMVSATVDRDTGTYEIREEPSRSSSYSSSYSSSSDDDSSRRSSYSSSYSSSSRDDSYSSSSSDSSYSSSSD
jgi:hypothetical protein